MSVERIVNRTLWRMIAFRLLGDVIGLPRVILIAIAELLISFARYFGAIEKTVFALEVDAARRYRALTHVDLGLAVGEPSRYSGTRVGVADARDQMMDKHGFGAGEDE